MKIKIITLAFLLCLSAGLPLSVRAVREVPKNEPLQAPPANSQQNYSQSINTPGSDINNTLQSQVTPVPNMDTNDTSDATSNQNPETNLDQTAPIVGDVPTTSTTFYWALLFIGLGGLMCLAFWAYFRFLRKQ